LAKKKEKQTNNSDKKTSFDTVEYSKDSVKKTSNISPIISWIVFAATITLVVITLTSAIFPALIPSVTSPFQEHTDIYTPVESFEPGMLAAPILATNLILLGIGILYYKKRSNSLNKILDFEISKRIALIVMIILLVIYVSATVTELSEQEIWVDYINVEKRVQDWTINDISSFDLHVRYFLLSSSLQLFENIHIVPFLASIALLILTYYITKQITNKRFAGIISVIILMQSHVFLTYDTSASYTNFWILFYLFSLYLILKRWEISPISYLASIPAKTLTLMFLPMTLFFIYRANIPRQKKIYSIISYGVIIAVFAIAIIVLDLNLSTVTSRIVEDNLGSGLSYIGQQLRFDVTLLVFLLPLIVGLFLTSKRGILQAESIMVLIAGMLIIPALLVTFTDQGNEPYRFVPLIVFFAIGVGMLFSKQIKQHF